MAKICLIFYKLWHNKIQNWKIYSLFKHFLLNIVLLLGLYSQRHKIKTEKSSRTKWIMGINKGFIFVQPYNYLVVTIGQRCKVLFFIFTQRRDSFSKHILVQNYFSFYYPFNWELSEYSAFETQLLSDRQFGIIPLSKETFVILKQWFSKGQKGFLGWSENDRTGLQKHIINLSTENI